MNDVLAELLEKDSFDFAKEWLYIDEYGLKILILASVLAENNLAYSGNLKTMCEWLGIISNATNNKNIKETLLYLHNQGYIDYKKNGQRWTIIITDKGMYDNDLIKIRKVWIDTIRKAKIQGLSISWIKVVKVFVYLYCNNDILTTSKSIGKALGISETSVNNAIKIIQSCRFDGIKPLKEVIKEKIMDENKTIDIRTIGTRYSVGISFV